MDNVFKPNPDIFGRLSWLRYGEQLSSQVVGSPTTTPIEVLTWNPGTGQVEVKMANGSRAITILPDGSASETLDQFRTTIRRTPEGGIESISEKLEDGRWTFFMRSVSVERTPTNIARYASSTKP